MGQRAGISKRRSLPSRSSASTRTTYGITSPARSMTMVSPMRMSLRSISSMLCSDAFRTVTPANCTGSRLATGVSVPVRPTWGWMSTIRVVDWRGLNL